MEARKVKIGNGWLWIKQGLTLMLHNPLLTVLLSVIVVSFVNLATRIGSLAPIVALLLMPAIVAGYMRACQAMQLHEKSVLAHLLAGFKTHTVRLLALGGMLLGGIIFSSMVAAAMGGEALVTFLQQAQEISDPAIMAEALQNAGPGVAMALLMAMLLMLLLQISLLQFAPMLVLLKGATTLDAIKAGLQGVLRNILPYMVYNVILFVVIAVLGKLPQFIGLVLAFTVLMTSQYSAYRDIYAEQQSAAAPE